MCSCLLQTKIPKQNTEQKDQYTDQFHTNATLIFWILFDRIHCILLTNLGQICI